MPNNPINHDNTTDPVERILWGLPPLPPLQVAPVEPAATDDDDCDDDNECGTCGGDCDDCRTCHACSDCVEDSDSLRGTDGHDYCESCYDSRFFECADCEETCVVTRYENYENPDGQRICSGCDCSYGSCDSCGCRRSNEDLRYRESCDSSYCDNCDPGGQYAEFEALHFPRRSTDAFDIIGSRRTYGLELETASCDGHNDLDGRAHFGAVTDGSINGMEFVSAVLHGDKGLDAIEDFCNRANRMGFEVDSSCGFHLHIGCRDLADGQLYAVAAAYAVTQSVWQSFVTTARRRNTYCGSLAWSVDDAANAWNDGESFADFAEQDRYQWLNLAAYNEHKTVEIRLHTATLNPIKCINWVKAHTRFVDAVSRLSIAEIMRRFGGSQTEQFAAIATIFGTDLAGYYRHRAAEFGTDYPVSIVAPASAQLALFVA